MSAGQRFEGHVAHLAQDFRTVYKPVGHHFVRIWTQKRQFKENQLTAPTGPMSHTSVSTHPVPQTRR